MDKLYYILDLKDDATLIARYRQWHAAGQVPSAIIASIREAGIDGMEIFLAGNRLVMAMTPGAGFDAGAKAAADAANPEVQKWEELMWNFQQALPFAAPGQKWVAAEKIFDLAQQPCQQP